MTKDDDSFVRTVDKIERLGKEPRSSPGEVWNALRDVYAEHDRLVNDTSPIGRALAAIRFAREHGLELQSATWDGTEEWRLTFCLPVKDAGPEAGIRIVNGDGEE